MNPQGLNWAKWLNDWQISTHIPVVGGHQVVGKSVNQLIGARKMSRRRPFSVAPHWGFFGVCVCHVMDATGWLNFLGD